MPYYRVCPHCGDNLDPGETCDCRKAAAKPNNLAQTNKPNKEADRWQAARAGKARAGK